MSADQVRRRFTGRRGLAVVAALVVLAVAAVLTLTLGGRDASPAAAPSPAGDPGTPTTTTPADPTGTATPPAPAPVDPAASVGPEQLPPSLPAVELDQAAEVGDGVTATIRSVEAIQGDGYAPGNIDGPALRVTVTLTNGTGQPIALDSVAVTLAYGDGATPASPLDDPSRAPFSGTLAPGDDTDGVYVFTVPADQRDPITISVGYRAGAPWLVFTGSAG